MRSLFFFAPAVLATSSFVACVGDDPPNSSSSSGGVDSGGGDSNVTPPDKDSGTPQDAASEEAPDAGPACAKVQVSTLAGTGAPGLVNGAGNVAKFDGVDGITVANDGTLYVGDSNNKAVRKILTDGTTSTYKAGGIILSATRLVYRFGDIYLVDRTNDQLLRITSSGASVTSVTAAGALVSVGLNAAGTIYGSQTQTCTISKLNAGFTAYETFTGQETPTCGSMDGNKTIATFSMNTLDFAFDGTDAMYVLDSGNFRIRKVNEVDGSVGTLAGSTTGHVDGQGSAAKFEAPTGITVDPQTHVVYVADKTTIRAVTSTGLVSTLSGSTAGFDDGDGCSAKFGNLKGITYFAGSLFAVDVNRVRKIKL